MKVKSAHEWLLCNDEKISLRFIVDYFGVNLDEKMQP